MCVGYAYIRKSLAVVYYVQMYYDCVMKLRSTTTRFFFLAIYNIHGLRNVFFLASNIAYMFLLLFR